MSGNKSKPSKTGDKKAETPEEEVMTEVIEEQKTEKSKDPKSGKKEKVKKARNIDPIIAVSATVLLVCCLIVIGYTIYDKTVADHTEPNVEYGDTVNVYYVGSFYDYYDQDGAVIFDTNMKDVAENSNYSFAYEWSAKDSYDLYEVTVGSGGALSMFEDALIGHHPGETVTVYIPKENGYKLNGQIQNGNAIGNTIDTERVFESTTKFKEFFGIDTVITTGPVYGVTSPYGWTADYLVDNSTDKVTVTYKATAGTTYLEEGSDIRYKVTSVENGVITYDMIINWNDKMIKTFDVYGNTIYITNYYAEAGEERLAGDFDYKIKTGSTTSDDREVSGENLYFVIKIVEYVESS